MTKEIFHVDPIGEGPDQKLDIIEHSPALYYLEANKYYLLKDQKAFKPNGELGARALTYINDGLGLEVELVWPAKTAQVIISGAGQITAPMECLYSDVDVLQKFLIDAGRLRVGRQNVNQFKP